MIKSLRITNFTKKPRLSLVTVKNGTKQYEDDLTEIFKTLLFVDPSESENSLYDGAKPFFREHFEKMEDRSFSLSLSGKWRGKLVNVDMKLVEGMPKLVQLNINGREVTTDLDKHPLVEYCS